VNLSRNELSILKVIGSRRAMLCIAVTRPMTKVQSGGHMQPAENKVSEETFV
jgi:hypothetical protein